MQPLTLLSDFGLHDAYVGIAKGVLLQYVPECRFLDLSHNIEPHNMQQAAYLLHAATRQFPGGSIHVVLIDALSGTRPRLLLCEQEGQKIISPDNGVIPLAFGEHTGTLWQCFELDAGLRFSDWLHELGKVLVQLLSQPLADLQLPPCEPNVVLRPLQPVATDNVLECHVLHIDRYENVILDLTQTQFENFGAGRPFRIQFMRSLDLSEISQSYHQVPINEKLCRFNDAGHLEICINRGNAASLFGLKLYREKDFFYNTVKITFG
ncbi:MAG: SAM-dependent chlorinase/fluorinase [Bacteroidetes bacterium]|nr:SAM-dependent chlorinase/fluorinase [Bacteroidota bacterium]MBS1629029.1 SAM-dependent chlorinase/fluorinase [Bacteroidota bacterium]